MQKVEIIKFLMALVCELEKVRTVCKLCIMLMHVFGRISVEWRNLTMHILAYRALLALNFVEKASLILISIEIMCGIILIIVKTFKYVCEERKISSKPMSASFRDYFLYVEGSIL